MNWKPFVRQLLDECSNCTLRLPLIAKKVRYQLHGALTYTDLLLERDLWKQKYLFEKRKTIALEDRARTSTVRLSI